MPSWLGLPELLIILVIVVLIFGVGRLPEVGEALGKAIRDFREAVSGQQSGRPLLVVGVGININSRLADFPDLLATRLTSVCAVTGRSFHLEPLLRACCSSIDAQVTCLAHAPDKFLALWDRRDYCKGRRLSWKSGNKYVIGVGRGIMADGCYCLEEENGRRHAVLAGTLQPLSERESGR